MKLKKLPILVFMGFAAFASTPSIAAPLVIEPDAEENFDVRGKLELPGAGAKLLPASLLLGYQDGKSYLSLAFSSKELILNRVAANGRATPLATIQKGYALAKGSTPFVAQWREGSLRV